MNRILIFLLAMVSNPVIAQEISELKQLSLEELLELEVTSVSRQPEKLTEAASAIQVITNEDIKRSTAIRLPEALQLASNLHTAQTNSHSWGISSRGFKGATLGPVSVANKLLVMIDGRTVYSPLFAGVFWDAQNVLLEDVDRIEVVSGPGGTLWGANAVNGVINIVSKNSKETQGLYATGSIGTFLNHHLGIRYGTKVSDSLYYRVYFQQISFDNSKTPEGNDASDEYSMNQGGFRMDYIISKKSSLIFQGDIYSGRENGPDSTFLDGQNLLTRWTHTFSERSNLSLQLYFDRTWREQVSDFREELTTYDLDFQHSFSLGESQKILWGVGYRYMQDRVDTTSSLIFIPPDLNFDFINLFLQDKISLIKDRLNITVGAKLSDNHFSGLGIQPSARLIWTMNDSNSVWAAVSRALRSASRFDADVTVPVIGKKDFAWEKLIAYELGYRMIPLPNVSASIAAFYNNYQDLRSIDLIDSSLVFLNNHKSTSWGVEFFATYQVRKWWKLRGGYTWFKSETEKTSETVVEGAETFEALDPEHQLFVHSIMDLPGDFYFDLICRYTSALPPSVILGAITLSPPVSDYFTLNVRLAWTYRDLEISLAGRNLLYKHHQEFGGLEIPRNIYGRVAWRL